MGDKIQRNKIQVSSSRAKNPTYRLRIYRDDTTVGDVSGRFAMHRDLYQLINNDGSCDKLLKKEFPPTLAKSSIGVKMSEMEVENRRNMLDEWFRDLFSRFNDFPEASRSTISKFVNLPESELELVEIPEPVIGEDAQGDSGESPKASVLGAAAGMAKKLLGNRTESNDQASEVQGLGAMKKSTSAKPLYQMPVYVSRGSDSGGHQTYEVNIKYHPNSRRMILQKEFKDYRSLMHKLAAHGIRHPEYEKPDADEETFAAVEYSSVIAIENPFPRTHLRSSLGLSLTEENLGQRCMLLDKWVRDVFYLYHSFAPGAKAVVNTFLGCSDEYENELAEHVVELLNVPNSVVGNKPIKTEDAVSAETTAKAEGSGDEPEVIKKAVRRDTLTQSNSIIVTQVPENGHPVFTMNVVRNGSVIGTVQGQFALFRDLYMKLNESGFCDQLLGTSFPATKRRSSLGFKLSDDMVEQRRAQLNAWLVELLDNFSDLDTERKNHISDFLSVESQKLELADPDEGPVSPDEGIPTASDETIQFSNRLDTVFVKTSRPDNLVQPNTVVITVAPDNGHPVYTLALLKDGAVLGEAVGQFAIYRELFTKVNSDNFCTNNLTAPFPATMRRSSLGLKMADDQVEKRREELNTVSLSRVCVICFIYYLLYCWLQWWVDLLDHFDAIAADKQQVISEFIKVSVQDMNLVPKTLPPEPPKTEATVKNTASSKKNDQPEDEWEDIPAGKKPEGCCCVS